MVTTAAQKDTAESNIDGFGTMLRRMRRRAGMTQEMLAEKAGISVRNLIYLEQGTVVPRRDTIALLLDALPLDESERAALLAAPALRGNDEDDSTEEQHAPLPVPATSLVGRTAEIETVCSLAVREDVRLITLTGPGGVGKTRVALAALTRLRSQSPGAVAFVALAGITDPALVLPTIAGTLGITAPKGATLLDALIRTIGRRRRVLLLDNFEQVLAAAPELTALLAACPRLTLLVTSRALLHLQGEHHFPIAPLAVPPRTQPPDGEQLARSDAVVLFVARAQAANPRFALTDSNAATVAAICRRVDGLPLAIELAATYIRLFPPHVLLARLERCLSLLVGGARDLPGRQQTMAGTIGWSYDLLPPSAQQVLQQLAIFVRGGTLEAAGEICRVPDSGDDLTMTLLLLLDHSLIQTDEDYQPADAAASDDNLAVRLTMLETIREYAWERLQASGELEAVRRRHALYYLSLAERAEPALSGPAQAEWLEQLRRDHDNLRAALRWAGENNEIELGLRLAAALWRFWFLQHHWNEGAEWLESFLARHGECEAPALVLARALNGAGVLAANAGNYPRAEARFEESLPLWQELDDVPGTLNALNNLGGVAHELHEYDRAVALFEQTLSLLGDQGDRMIKARLLANLGEAEQARGHTEAAVAWLEESLALYRTANERWGIAAALRTLGRLVALHGNHRRAREFYAESLSLDRQIRHPKGIVGSIEGLAALAALEGTPQRAASLFAAAAALRQRFSLPRSPAETDLYEAQLASVKRALGDEEYMEAWMRGGGYTLEQAVAEALAQPNQYT